jgi:hypothetical protein
VVREFSDYNDERTIAEIMQEEISTDNFYRINNMSFEDDSIEADKAIFCHKYYYGYKGNSAIEEEEKISYIKCLLINPVCGE